MYQFVRTAAAVPKLRVADCAYNIEQMKSMIESAAKKQVQILAFPELSITSYTCGDLFFQSALLEAAEASLKDLLSFSEQFPMLILAGLPVRADNQCFNACALLLQGQLLGVVPKTHLPNYGEFYEKRHFSPASALQSTEITLCGRQVPIGTDLVFCSNETPNLKIGIEICEDLWAPIPPSTQLALAGATLLLNASASNALAAKSEYRRALVSHQSAAAFSAYVYASAGSGESTTDMVFDGHSLIFENGSLLSESKKFSLENEYILADIDLELLANERRRNTSFLTPHPLPAFRRVFFSLPDQKWDMLKRYVNKTPFIPKQDANLADRCTEIFQIQVYGLIKRIQHTHCQSLVIGISGGLDSTLALLVCVKAVDTLGLSRRMIHGITMPGFGTTGRTYQNALDLMDALGITKSEIPIRDAAMLHFQDIGHDPSVHDVCYENTQARERTQILMDLANKQNGLVVGTGDLSELALGFATYNGDHMSMYGVNSGVPKTLVRVLIKWIATAGVLDPAAAGILQDILDTPVSPELLPPTDDGKIDQKTEEIVGPYELHDFFLYYSIRYGFSPAKVYFLAKQAFSGAYPNETILHFLQSFYRRFFAQQFKRSCMPDGPKVGALNLSPRGDWRMPSDASAALWRAEADALES